MMVAQLVLLVALAPSALTGRFGSTQVNLALCLVAAAWALLTPLPVIRRSAAAALTFLAGLVVITLVLVFRDPWFGFYAYAVCTSSLILLPWPWELGGAAATAVVEAIAQTGGLDRATPAGIAACAGILAGDLAAMGGLFWFLHRIEAEHAERGRVVDELQESNRRLEAALAENAGLHQQLVTQAREAGVLDERQRMAREIHDTLAQGLTGIITQLQAAEHASDEPAEWRKHFTAATGLARESLTEARRSVDALRPQQLERVSLFEALADAARLWSSRTSIPVQVTTTGTKQPLCPEAEAALLRTAQEALANVAKHAQATRVGVTLSYLGEQVALDVRDDGKGFDPAWVVSPRGFGLEAMRQRVEGLAGTLQIESEPGAGTGISACVPVALR